MLRIATRGSALALFQARWVAEHLGAAELVVVSTHGDREQGLPVGSIGGRGVFVKEVEQAVLDGHADLAVHSAKDLPANDPEGLVIAAVPTREDPRDVLVGATLAQLGTGAVVATGSPRRRAQLSWLRSDLGFSDLRGNIGTRLERVPPGGAVVMAAAALRRLDLWDRASQVLDPSLMIPQAGQGCLALQCKSDDHATIAKLASVDHRDSHASLIAERAFLSRLEAGCDTAAGALATVRADGVEIQGVLASADGQMLARRSARGTDPQRVGTALAEDFLTSCGGALFVGQGGYEEGIGPVLAPQR